MGVFFIILIEQPLVVFCALAIVLKMANVGKVPDLSVFRAELWAIWCGILLTLEGGETNVYCEINSVDPYTLVNNWNFSADHWEAIIIHKIHDLVGTGVLLFVSTWCIARPTKLQKVWSFF
ncbi:hypothetical protein PIB30_010221 [Stylosanthes scabra]|uniref:Uncharacterized protein n=1 Tax=Stylosanthes scabra TaxID=79078 RepID=A0ABU6S603_9FABA|nr:hypothetical protein [Stylosanthes scabra]